MNIFIILLILVVSVALVYIYTTNSKICIKSMNDNNRYCVLQDTKENMSENVELLAKVHSDILMLIIQLEASNHQDLANKLRAKYSHNTISEAMVQNGYTSYTINKHKIHVCIRSRDKEAQVYDSNTLMYVILHELSHLISTTTGHNDEFKDIFKILVKNAIKARVYKYVDYSENNINYCGLVLTTNIVSDDY